MYVHIYIGTLHRNSHFSGFILELTPPTSSLHRGRYHVRGVVKAIGQNQEDLQTSRRRPAGLPQNIPPLECFAAKMLHPGLIFLATSAESRLAVRCTPSTSRVGSWWRFHEDAAPHPKSQPSSTTRTITLLGRFIMEQRSEPCPRRFLLATSTSVGYRW